MSTEPRQATEAEIAALRAITGPMVDYLRSMPGQTGLHAFCMIAAELVLTAGTDIPKVEAWDHVAASIRRTIAENVKRGLS